MFGLKEKRKADWLSFHIILCLYCAMRGQPIVVPATAAARIVRKRTKRRKITENFNKAGPAGSV